MKFSLFGITGFVCGTLIFALPSFAWQAGHTTNQQSSNSNYAGQNRQSNGTQQQGQSYQQQLQQQQQTIAAPQQPAGFPLPKAEQDYIQQLLAFWEGTSSQIKRYRCTFRRWQIDHEVCNYRNPDNNQLVAAMISVGTVRYSSPDNGMYEVLQKWQFTAPPANPGEDAVYERPAQKNPDFIETEKWICDGKKIYEYDYQNKRLYELTLPPEAQGEGLKNSPLPFVFGAKATELLERYWIRDVTPTSAHGQQYWLEAWPKRTSDAQAYSKIEIILSRDPFLPIAIHMYAPNYDPKLNPSKMVFAFEERQINGKLDNLSDFMKNFINPRTPFGWDRVPRDLIQDPRDQQNPRLGQVPQQTGNQTRQGR